jgi:hypothetical protein
MRSSRFCSILLPCSQQFVEGHELVLGQDHAGPEPEQRQRAAAVHAGEVLRPPGMSVARLDVRRRRSECRSILRIGMHNLPRLLPSADAHQAKPAVFWGDEEFTHATSGTNRPGLQRI